MLNAIKQWVLHHFYDFERDITLQVKLEEFLDTADKNKGKNCVCPSRIFESVRKCLRKAVSIILLYWYTNAFKNSSVYLRF